MSTAKKKSTKGAAKAPARKAATPKGGAAARKKPVKPAKPAKPAVRREEPTPSAEPREPRAARSRGAAAAAARPPLGADPRGRLGAKWVCFKCGAKFYDLNKPEPLCPKCGANQSERPKREARPKQPVAEAPPPRPVVVVDPDPDRDILPGEEEEEDALLMEDEEIDLGTPELDGEAEDFGEEEEEEPGDA